MASRRKEVKSTKAEVKQPPKKVADPLHTFAERVRDHKELDSRWAVLQETRVEYFRGKDFATLVRQHPDVADVVVENPDALLGEKPVEEQLAAMLLKRKLILRCDRVVKTVRPGRKKLSKWPARLEIHPAQLFTEDDGFYAWTFERRRPFWQTLLSFMLPIITVACCLFPVFPHWAKLAVLYFCLTFLSLIFGILLLRWVVFGTIWIVAGRRVWFFPNILAEEASLVELFRFLPDFSKDEEPPPKLTTRLAVFAFTGLCIWLSVRNAPDEHTRAHYRKKVGNIIDEVLTWSPAMLAGNTSVAADPSTAQETPAPNVTQDEKASSKEENETEAIHKIFAQAADLANDFIGEDDFGIEGELTEVAKDRKGEETAGEGFETVESDEQTDRQADDPL